MVFAEPRTVGWVIGNQSSLGFRVPGLLLRRLVETDEFVLVPGSEPFVTETAVGRHHGSDPANKESEP
jgi:hypothetical protein